MKPPPEAESLEDESGAVLRTPRLVLCPFAPDEVDALRRLFGRPRVRRYLWDDVSPSFEQVAALQAESARCFARHGWGLWLLRVPGDDSLAGYCGIRPLRSSGEVELGYALSPERWGAGLATEAARAVLDHAFAPSQLGHIVALTDLPNSASQRVLLRLGFHLEGPLVREGPLLLRWSLRREDWRAARRQGP